MAQDTVTKLLQIDVAYNDARLIDLQKQLNENKRATDALNKAFKDNAISADDYAKAQVRLAGEARTLRGEINVLNKVNDNYIKGNAAAAGSIDELRAQLSANTKAWNALSREERENEAIGGALQKQTKAISDELKVLESSVGDTRRNVGNYREALEPLIQELVKLEEQMKNLPEGSDEYRKAAVAVKGFQTQVQQAAAKSGQSFEEAQAKIKGYSDAIRPAVAQVVKLEAEQEKLEEGSEAYQRIGFQIGKLNKQVAGTSKETQKASEALNEVVSQSSLLGSVTERYTAAKEQYTTVVNLAKVATLGEAGALNVLKLALLATGLGALVVLLGSVVAFLTKTQAGTDLLSRKMAYLGGLITPLTNKFTEFGGKIVEALDNPKKALQDLVDFIVQNVINRFTSFGVILDGIRNKDFRKITDGVIQFNTGVADGTRKLQDFASELNKAGTAAERLAQIQRELERAEDDNITTNKTLLNQVERLKNLRDDESKSIGARMRANEEAYRLERLREDTLAGLARRRAALLREQIELEGGRDKVSRERYQELKNAENELADILEDAAGKQNELITNRVSLQREAYEQMLADLKARLERETLLAAEGSREQLEARVKLLEETAKAEAKQMGLTAAQRRLIEQKALGEIAQLRADFRAKEEEAASRKVEQDIAAAGRELQERERVYQTRLRDLDRFLQTQRNVIEQDYAQGLITDKEYKDRLYMQDQAAIEARIRLAKLYNKDVDALNQQLTDLQNTRSREATEKQQDEYQRQAKLYAEYSAVLGQLFADTINGSKTAAEDFFKTLAVMLIDSVEQSIIAAQIKILAESFSKADSIATFGATGGIRAAVIIAAVQAASAGLKAALQSSGPSRYATGGYVQGPGTGTSDSIPARLSNGESVINARSTAMFRPLLSYLNVAGGGVAFATGGVAGAPPLPSLGDAGATVRAAATIGAIDYKLLAFEISQVVPREIAITKINQAQNQRNKARALVTLK